MRSDCFIFQLYTLWQFHHWGLLLLTQGVGHIGFPLRALLVGSNHSESGKPKEKFILTDGVTEYPRVLPDNSKSRSLDMWNKQFRGDFLARRLYIIRLWSWTAQFLAAEAWQVYWVQHNLILGVSMRTVQLVSRSFSDLPKSHQCRQRKIEKKKKVSSQNLRPSTRIRWEITSTVTSAQHVKYRGTLIRFTRRISWSQLRTKPTLRLRLSHFFWRFQPEFKVKEKICLGNTDKKSFKTILRLWNLASTKLNCIFSFVFATWLPLWRKPIKGRMKQKTEKNFSQNLPGFVSSPDVKIPQSDGKKYNRLLKHPTTGYFMHISSNTIQLFGFGFFF